MKYKNIIIYGGTSEIAIELIKSYLDDCNKIIIFCTSKKKFFDLCKKYQTKFANEKLELVEVDLLELDKNLNMIKSFENNISGIFWIAGKTGDSRQEYDNIKSAENNLKINFINPTLILNEMSKKMIKDKNSFIAVFTSVAGLRGRKKQLFYSSGKAGLIAYLSGLRQKVNESGILVTTIIPGYMNTKPFREGAWKAPNFLITQPNKVALKVKNGIQDKKELIFINSFWKFIMFAINLVPEKIYKRLSF